MKLTHNELIIISSLRKNDRNTPLRLEEDLIHCINSSSIEKITRYPVISRNDLLDHLDKIALSVKNTSQPIIHIEAHGSTEGMELNNIEQGTVEHITWDLVCNKLSKINQLTNCKLAVFSASCFGLYALKPLSIHKYTPFAVLLGPQRVITDDELLEGNIKFYKSLACDADFKVAHSHISNYVDIYVATDFFTDVICNYFKEGCMGEGKSERVERLVTEALWRSGNKNNPHILRAYRKHAKKNFKPTKKILDKYAMRFFGKATYYDKTFTEVLKIAKNRPHPKQRTYFSSRCSK